MLIRFCIIGKQYNSSKLKVLFCNKSLGCFSLVDSCVCVLTFKYYPKYILYKIGKVLYEKKKYVNSSYAVYAYFFFFNNKRMYSYLCFFFFSWCFCNSTCWLCLLIDFYLIVKEPACWQGAFFFNII